MFHKVAIVGVGLIGGSFALALRRAGLVERVLGVSSQTTVSEALRLGVIDEGATLESAAEQADLIYLAQPISAILETLRKLGTLVRPGTLVTDAGSTKVSIVNAAAGGVSFLGGHPMAGREVRGVAAADAALFEGRPYLLTPTADIDSLPQGLRFLDAVRQIGAEPVILSAADHDRIVGASSHLPQLLSTALAAMLDAHPDSARIRDAAGPGLVDSTRLALSDYGLWRDILATNRDEAVALLDAYAMELQSLRDAVKSGNAEAAFQAANRFASSLRRP